MSNNREDLLTINEGSPRSKELRNVTNSINPFLTLSRDTSIFKVRKVSDDLKNLQILQDSIVYQRNTSLISKYQNALINIPLPIDIIRNQGRSFVCEGSIGPTTVKFFISCGYWYKLKLTQREVALGVFNLLDHFGELLPPQSKIELITFQNGIQNSPADFEKMGTKICEKIPEGTLCIGLYNPTEGLLTDLLRVNHKLNAELSDICCYTLALMKTFAKKLWRPLQGIARPYWCHFAHSEGGIIARLSLILMEHDKSFENIFVKNAIETHFIPVTYGAVLPIPNSYTKNAMNTYSNKDEATLPRVQRYLNSIGSTKRNYTNVKIVKCEKLPNLTKEVCHKDKVSAEKFKQMSLWERYAYIESLKAEVACTVGVTPINAGLNYVKGDHEFQGSTYQKALSANINYLRKSYNGFYSGG